MKRKEKNMTKPIQLLSEDTFLDLSPRRTYEIYLALHNVYSAQLKKLDEMIEEGVKNAD